MIALTERNKNSIILGTVAIFALVTLIYPVVRSFYRFEISYNEGWNIYNALKVIDHVPLYNAKYSWTTTNYPALSFYVLAYLSRVTHNYLLTGRLLSLLSLAISCVLIGLIIRKLTRNFAASFFGAFFCLAFFCCTDAMRYVGLNDPQMFAQVFFLSGLLLYVSKPPTFGCIAAVATLFIIGGCIKQNLIEFPLTVFVDLLFLSRKKAMQYVLVSGALLGIAIVLNIELGGPFFIWNVAGPRSYSISVALLDFVHTYGQIVIPLLIACIWVFMNLRDRVRRPICSFFIISLIVDVAIKGGNGVTVNTYFGNFFALSMIMGLVVHDTWEASSIFLGHRIMWRCVIPVFLTAYLLAPFFVSDTSDSWSQIGTLPEEQKRFDTETSFLRAQPGPAICESLLRCYYAGKPYEIDPFNSTRFVRANKLDSGEIVRKIEKHQYGAIQLNRPVESFKRPSNRFPDEVLDAINQYYVPSLVDANCVIYVPNH